MNTGVCINHEKDRPKWKIARNGNFNVKDAVRWLHNSGQEWKPELWNKIWLNTLIPKIAFFTWLAAHNKLATIDNLQKKESQIWRELLKMMQTQWTPP